MRRYSNNDNNDSNNDNNDSNNDNNDSKNDNNDSKNDSNNNTTTTTGGVWSADLVSTSVAQTACRISRMII